MCAATRVLYLDICSPVCPVILIFKKKEEEKTPSGLRCGNLAKHFVPHASLFSTPVQKYRSSVKALIHNSPPSVHSTCCVIKAVVYPLLLPLVSISLTLVLFVLCTRFFSLFFFNLFIYFSYRLLHKLPHFFSSFVIFRLPCLPSFISRSVPSLWLCLAYFLIHAQYFLLLFLTLPLLFPLLFFIIHDFFFPLSHFLKYCAFPDSPFHNACQYHICSSLRSIRIFLNSSVLLSWTVCVHPRMCVHVCRCVLVRSQSHQVHCGGWQCGGPVNQFLL